MKLYEACSIFVESQSPGQNVIIKKSLVTSKDNVSHLLACPVYHMKHNDKFHTSALPNIQFEFKNFFHSKCTSIFHLDY